MSGSRNPLPLPCFVMLMVSNHAVNPQHTRTGTHGVDQPAPLKCRSLRSQLSEHGSLWSIHRPTPICNNPSRVRPEENSLPGEPVLSRESIHDICFWTTLLGAEIIAPPAGVTSLQHLATFLLCAGNKSARRRRKIMQARAAPPFAAPVAAS